MKILMIDDEEGFILSMRSEFAEFGTSIFRGEFENARWEEFFDLFKPDALIVDYSMPSPDGLAIYESLQARLPKFPFIFLTGKIATLEDPHVDEGFIGGLPGLVKGPHLTAVRIEERVRKLLSGDQ